MLLFRSLSAMLLAAVVLSACGGGSSSGSSSELSTPLIGFPGGQVAPTNNELMQSCKTLATLSANSSITGTIQYQRVPFGASWASGLDYSNTVNLPVRGVVVQAVQVLDNRCSEKVVTSSLTNGRGEYGLDVPGNQAVCVQVRAQLYRDGSRGGASWDIQILDNTSADAPYYLVDNRMATPSELPQRNLLAASGAAVGSSRYTSERAAAPFAILDTLCEAVDTLVGVDATVELPMLLVNWSEFNIAADGAVEEGEIGGAFYQQSQLIDSNNNIASVEHKIFLLGDADNNTDEYDAHVISHEFAHFITASLSRYDSVGGGHSLDDHLDMRVAFEEGWADAFSGMALDSAADITASPYRYKDSLGSGQGRSFRFSLGLNNRVVKGWYSEASVFSIIYNLFDEVNNGANDYLSLGFAPVYAVISSPGYQESESLLSIYTFINHLKQQTSDDAAIDALVSGQDFESIADDFGSGENMANNDVRHATDVESIYSEFAVNANMELCSNNQFGEGNKLSVGQFIKFNAVSNRTYRFAVKPMSNSFSGGQALLSIYKRGRLQASASANTPGELLTLSARLSGLNILVLTDVSNSDEGAQVFARRCFSLQVE